MLAKIMIVFVTAAALTAGPTADAFAFSGGVSHVVRIRLPRLRVPITVPTAAIRLRTDGRQRRAGDNVGRRTNGGDRLG